MAEAVTVLAGVSMLRIERCRDPLKWYAGMIGKFVPNLGYHHDSNEWRSREPAGYINFIARDDAVPVVVTVEVPMSMIPDGDG